ncbi:MAG: hypothetical protein AVO34_11630, partial [Firmicutes bacterium ML8_F2]
MQKIGTHDGIFHCDDVMCYAILRLLYDHLWLVRSRNVEELENCNILFDVGGSYSPHKGIFDHHFGEISIRNNGVPYASAGLVWKHCGISLLEKKLPYRNAEEIRQLHEKIDRVLIQSVDAHDTRYYPSYRDFHYTLSQLISSFIPRWNDNFSPENLDRMFREAGEVCSDILENNIYYYDSLIDAEKVILEKYQQGLQEGIIVIEQYVPFDSCILKYGLDVDFVVYRMGENEWIVQSASRKFGGVIDRKLFPQSWAGKEGKDLEEATGIQGAIFCHQQRFVAG